jgi:histidine triad (HIT) family protein
VSARAEFFPVAECVFCQRVRREEYEGQTYVHYGSSELRVVRFAPLNPVVDGHMLFIPDVHAANAAEYPAAAGAAFTAASSFGMVQAQDFNLITSSGPAATQTVQHLHVHYVPREAGDGLTLPWTGQQK